MNSIDMFEAKTHLALFVGEPDMGKASCLGVTRRGKSVTEMLEDRHQGK